jgi:hypothetical protein
MSLALEILTLAVGAMAMVLVLPRAPRRSRASRPPARSIRPADLERVERSVTERVTASGVHVRLRPLLAEIASARLSRARGLTQVEARALLGEELWDLVRPDRPRPENPNGAGLSTDELERMAERLEQL